MSRRIISEQVQSEVPSTEQGTRFDKEAAQEEARDFGVLSAQPRVRVLLPRIPGDREEHPLEVFLNGVPYFIPKGMAVDVPEDIAAILQHAKLV